VSLTVAIIAARREVEQEASAISRALSAAGHRVSLLCQDASAAAPSAPAGGRNRGRRWPSFKDMIAWSRERDVLRALALFAKIGASRRALRDRFAALQPDAIVIFDDRRVIPDLVARFLAKELGIPTVIAPFAVSTVEADAHMRKGSARLAIEQPPMRWLKRLIARSWPSQIEAAVGTPMLFYGPWETLMLALRGMLPTRPWVLGGSGPEIVCAAGQDHRDYLLRGGVAPPSIAVTGYASLDEMKEVRPGLRDVLSSSYGLPRDRPLVVCAVPQHGEHGMVSWDRHMTMTEDLFASLAGAPAAVLLSLHPKSRLGDYEAAAARHCLPILQERLAQVLPAADLLVATFSSTVGWAIGLGIPAIVVDGMGAGFTLYRDLPGVLRVESHVELADALKRTLRTPAALDDLRRAAAASAARVVLLDGKAGQRIVGAVEAAAALRKRRQPGSDPGRNQEAA